MTVPVLLVDGAKPEANFAALAQGVCWTKRLSELHNESAILSSQFKPQLYITVASVALSIILGHYVIAAVIAIVAATIYTKSDLYAKRCQNEVNLNSERGVLDTIASQVRVFLVGKGEALTRVTDIQRSWKDAFETWKKENASLIENCSKIEHSLNEDERRLGPLQGYIQCFYDVRIQSNFIMETIQVANERYKIND